MFFKLFFKIIIIKYFVIYNSILRFLYLSKYNDILNSNNDLK